VNLTNVFLLHNRCFFFNLASKLTLKSRLGTHHRITTLIDQLFKPNLTFCLVCIFNLQFENSVFLRRIVRSQSTIQRQLRRQILKNTLYIGIYIYPVHVGLNISGANRTHLALTFMSCHSNRSGHLHH
jgi:hypothetical protein